MTEHKVFISYTNSDWEWARHFAVSLGETGLRVSPEFDNPPGGTWQDAMEESLRDSDVIAVLVHPDILDRPQLYFEIGAALALRKTIIPIVPRELDLCEIPLLLRRKRTMTRESPAETAREFADAVDMIGDAPLEESATAYCYSLS